MIEKEAAYAIVILMIIHSDSTSVLNVRVSPDERAMLEAAAEHARTTLSDFVRRSALQAAEIDIRNWTIVQIPAKDWDAFEAWVTRPAAVIPALQELVGRTATWEP